MILAKFGRNLCCSFNPNVMCVHLFDGERRCILDGYGKPKNIIRKIVVTKSGKAFFSFCSLLPKSQIDKELDFYKKAEEDGSIIVESEEAYFKRRFGIDS